jgi:hypothetical protein
MKHDLEPPPSRQWRDTCTQHNRHCPGRPAHHHQPLLTPVRALPRPAHQTTTHATSVRALCQAKPRPPIGCMGSRDGTAASLTPAAWRGRHTAVRVQWRAAPSQQTLDALYYLCDAIAVVPCPRAPSACPVCACCAGGAPFKPNTPHAAAHPRTPCPTAGLACRPCSHPGSEPQQPHWHAPL